jgi:hypothetical protein
MKKKTFRQKVIRIVRINMILWFFGRFYKENSHCVVKMHFLGFFTGFIQGIYKKYVIKSWQELINCSWKISFRNKCDNFMAEFVCEIFLCLF